MTISPESNAMQRRERGSDNHDPEIRSGIEPQKISIVLLVSINDLSILFFFSISHPSLSVASSLIYDHLLHFNCQSNGGILIVQAPQSQLYCRSTEHSQISDPTKS